MDGVDKLIQKNCKISDMQVHFLKQISNEKGKLLHMIRHDSPFFSKFGEVYFSFVNFNHIKAWKRHKIMEQNFAVPVGEVKLVIYDDRPSSPSYKEIEELVIGESPDKYYLVKIPPLVWYGIQGISVNPALVVNCSTHAHDPLESEGMDLHSTNIPFRWEISSKELI